MSKIGMLEDMDVQLRSQLEKIIVQRNQLGAEKATRDIEARGSSVTIYTCIYDTLTFFIVILCACVHNRRPPACTSGQACSYVCPHLLLESDFLQPT